MKIEMNVIMPDINEFEKQAWEALSTQIKEYIESKLKDITCEEHHEQPKITVSGSMKEPIYNISGCCQNLIDKATEALNK
jgi:hypothetical protein